MISYPEGAAWRKSSYSSGNNGNCVEIALPARSAAIRDSKNPYGGHLTIATEEFSHLLASVKAGLFDR